MTANLKLVPKARLVLNRPIRTEYRGPGHGGVGHSRTVQGALKAALPRVIGGEFSGATIWDEDDLVAFQIKRKGNHTTVTAVTPQV